MLLTRTKPVCKGEVSAKGFLLITHRFSFQPLTSSLDGEMMGVVVWPGGSQRGNCVNASCCILARL